MRKTILGLTIFVSTLLVACGGGGGDGSSGARVGIGTTSPLSHLTFESDHWNTGTEDGPSIRLSLIHI
mgnify:CR=1 FL=1